MMRECRICPRNCGADRENGKSGYCGMLSEIYVARAALHFWEEPCISGEEGSGTVFFSGCNLKCIYCQNSKIALGNSGNAVTQAQLDGIFEKLLNEGANNINLVTPTHYIPEIASAIERAKKRGFPLPFVYNTGGYELIDSLKILDGLVDIYMPDFKYWTKETAKNYSNAPDYPERAKEAIDEMYRQCPEAVYDERGIMQKGLIVRHMLIGKHVYEAKRIVSYLFEKYKNNIVYSLMSQYTPMGKFEKFPELERRVSQKEYDSFVDYCIEIGVENAFIQSGESAKESFIPEF